MSAFLSSLIMLLAACLTIASAQDRPLSVYNPAEPVVSSSGSITLLPGFHVPAGSSFHAFISGYNTTPLAPALSQNQNYIVTYTPREPFTSGVDLSSKAVGEVMQSVQYFDGLGRPLQTVQTKGSPGADKDIVIPVEYDAFGREVKKYLPYASGSKDGSYKADGLSAQGSFYQSPPAGVPTISSPYAQTVFESSPLNRVLEQGAPGNSWQPYSASMAESGHTVKQEYSTNTMAGDRSVRLFRADVGTGYTRTLSSSGNYGASQLYLTITKDENWSIGKSGTTEEYKDKEGRVVLKRVWESESVSLSTYYVYDDFGNLSFVLPPGSGADGATPDQIKQDLWCYQYRYDERNRLVEKKVPGRGWDLMVYNQLDQLVLTQDPLQRNNHQWTVTKYDAHGRLIITGLWNAGSLIQRATLQSSIYAASQWDTRDRTNNTTQNPTGYVITSYPAPSSNLVLNYYDDYTFPGATVFGSADPNSSLGQSDEVKGLLTGTRVNVLQTGTMLVSANYYDNKGRVIQSKSQNHLGGTDIVNNTYGFTDELLTSVRTHTVGGQTTTIASRYTYDHMGRKTETRQSTGAANAAEVLLSKLDYNAVGQLKSKAIGDGLQTLNYGYNERGWMRAMTTSSNLFSLDLRYNTPDWGTPQYNGNISQMQYLTTKVASPGSKAFTYTYDKLNRLTIAASTQGALDEQMSYDQMGNISQLVRGGAGGGTLAYPVYEGNQLKTVTGYSPRSYQYDANGNAGSDGMGKNIRYNLLNLPQSVTSGTTTVATYTYDASGNKLKNTGTDGSWDYVNGIVYKNSAIDFVSTEEGRVRLIGGAWNYEYNLKDHLGNTRVSIDRYQGAPRVIQEDEYYSFGLRKPTGGYDYSNNNRYLYNGKEIQTDLANQYDYGARFYDPVIARWNVVDPLVEKYQPISPYVYALNNPLLFVDVDGRDIYIPITKGDFTQKAFTQLQSLTSDRLALLQTGQVVKYGSIDPNSTSMFNIRFVGDNLSPVRKEFGTKLVSAIIDSDYKITIKDSQGGSERLSKGDKEATLYHDADTDNRGIQNEDGTGGMKPQSALGHELIHGRNYLNDKDDQTVVEVKDPDTGKVRGMTKEELNTRKAENNIRDEQLDKRRAQPRVIK
ncbi:RHS repeat-associated protein [Arcticibacter pallidicorallinus]|uniref:RHS repeat-associated protein n=1 Tax=Arcticibacter pallidicorallinus TaxID=1259464 RepID=A0A2T0TQW2_9SPHI|nr:DUF6443 domain-containing protein [Arcticibacter pallidicorallinus]PRY48070.1 RHS repeat-associated protein [Arcticibacter pallidicorallinus]